MILTRGLAMLLAAMAFDGFNAPSLAATDTWTGSDTAGSPTTDWFNADNWAYSAGTGPVASGDSLVFGGSNGQSTDVLTDSLTNASFIINGITFNAGAPGYTLTGNAFQLIGGIFNSSASIETIGNAIVEGTSDTYSMTGGDQIDITGSISDGGLGYGVATSGTGTLILSGSNSYGGLTTVAAGTTLELEANAGNTVGGVTSALSNATAQLALSAGSTLELLGNTNNTIFESGTAAATAVGAGIQETNGGTYNFFVGNNGGTVSPTTLILGNMGVLGEAGSTSYTLDVTGVSGYTLQLGSGTSGTGSLYFENPVTINSQRPSVTVSVPGGFTVNYPAAYALTFGGIGNFNLGPLSGGSGTLNVNFDTAGTSLLNAASTALGTVALNAGTTELNFAASGAPTTNILTAATKLTMAGGTLDVAGIGASSTQAVTSLTSTPGMNTITVTGSATLALGAVTQNLGAELVINGPAYDSNATGASTVLVPATGTITTTTVGNLTNLFIPANRISVATVGLYNFASDSTTAGNPNTILSGDQVSGFYTEASGGIGSGDINVDWAAGANSDTGPSIEYLDTMRFNAVGAASFADTDSAGRFYTAGVLVTPNVGPYNITLMATGAMPTLWSFNQAPSGGANGSINFYQNNTEGELLFDAGFTNAKTYATAYAQAGPGTVVMTGEVSANFNTLSYYLNGGVTEINADVQLGPVATAAPVYLDGGTVLSATNLSLDNGAGGNLRPITLEGNGGGLAATAGDAMTVDGLISGAAGSGRLIIGIPASVNNGNVAGQVPGTGAGTANSQVLATGTVVLTSTTGNTFYGGALVTGSATLNINSEYQLGGANYGGLTLAGGGILQYSSSLLNAVTDLSQNSAGTAELVTLATGGGTIDVNGHAVTFANSVGNSGPGSLTVASSNAGGSLTLNGNNTFTGGITVNSGVALTLGGANVGTGPTTVSGTLALSAAGSLGNTAITVTSGGAFNAKAGSGDIQIGTTGASLTLNAGSGFSMSDGSIGTVTLNALGGGSGTVLTLGGTTASPASLTFDVGAAGADQLIVNNGTVSFASSAQDNILLTALAGAAPQSLTNIPLLSIPNGALVLGDFDLVTSAVSLGGASYLSSLSLGGAGGDTELLLNLAPASLDYYWTGNVSGSWAASGNFATNHTGANAQPGVPGSQNSVFLTADSAANFTQTLNQSFSINSLSFTSGTTAAGSNSITLSGGAGANTLTLLGLNSFSNSNGSLVYPAGTGLVVQAGSAQHTISANIVLGSSQTWEIDNAPSNGLFVSGNVGDGGSGYGLTKTGAGTLILAGTGTYTGATTVNGGTLQLGNGVIAGGGSVSGNIVDNATLILDRPDNYSLGNNISGAGLLEQNGPDTVTLTAANSFTGSTVISSGTLVLGNSLALAGSVVNYSSPGGTLSFGTLTSATLGGLIGTQNLALSNASAAPVALTLVNNAPTASYSGALSGGGSLIKNGTSTLSLSGSSSYDGSTTINAGVLQISAADNLGDGSANNALNMNGTTLESTANTYDLGASRTVALTGSDNFQVDSGSSLSISGSITGTGSITTTGVGNLTINGVLGDTGPIYVETGMLTIGPSGSVNATTSLTVGNGAALNVAGGNLSLPAVAGNPYLDYIAGGNNSQVYVSGGTFTYGNIATADPNQALLGYFTQTGGTVTTVETDMAPLAGNTFSLYIGGTGQYISSTGLYATFTVGTRGVASAYVSGSGSLMVNGPMIVGAQYSNAGGDTAGTRTFVQQGGAVTTTSLTLGAVATTAAAPGVYYLNGGTLTTNALVRGAVGGTSGGTLDLGGGTLESGTAFTVAAGGITTLVNSGGGTINTSGGNITWSGVIGAGSTGNVTGYTGLSGGSGYTVAPTVTISAPPTGTTATAVAEINASGQVIDVVITNPGSGYTSAPTFTFSAPTNGTTAAVTAGTIATNNGGLTVTGTNTLFLGAANTYTGTTNINGGVLSLSSTNALGGGGPITFGGGRLQYSANNAADHSARIVNSTGPISLDVNGQNLNYGSPLAASNTGGLTLFSTTGSGSLTLNGANGYTGPTTVSVGTLTLAAGASLSDTPISLAANTTLAVESTTTIGNTLGSLTMAGGSTFTMQDNTIDTVTLNAPGAGMGTVLNVGDSNAAASLYFDFDSVGSDELIVNNGTTSFGADGGMIYLKDIDANAPLSSYTLISDPNGGLADGTAPGADFQLASTTLTAGGVTYNVSLANSTSTSEVLTLTPIPVSDAYWTGTGTTNNSSWSDLTNFATDHTGATRISGFLSASTNVFLTADTAGNFNQTLDGNYTINSLNLTGAGTSAGGNPITLSNGTGTALTIDSTSAYTDANGNHYTNTGIVVQAGAPADTINANIILGNSQSWEIDNAPANGLVVTGTVSSSGSNTVLTKTGAGTLILNNTETYAGGIQVAAGTLAMGPSGLLPAASGLRVTGSGTFDLAGTSQTVARLSDGGVSTGVITSSAGAATLAISNTNASTFSGTITDNNSANPSASLALVLQGTSNVTLSGSNSFTGGTTLVSGDLTAVNNYALGSGTSQNANAGLTFNNAGTVTAYFTSANPNVAALTMGTLSSGSTYIILGNSTTSGSATTLYVGGAGGTSNFTGVISDLSGVAAGAVGNLTVDGGGFLGLAGANTFTGTTVITGSGANGVSELQLENPLALQDSTLNYNDPQGIISFGSLTAATLGGLTGSENLSLANSTSNGVTLTIGNANVSPPYTGNLSGAGGVVKVGTGTVQFGSGTLGGATYQGTTTVSQGTLIIGGTSNLTGAILVPGANGVSALTVQDNAVVNTASELITESAGGNAYPAASTVTVQGNGSLTAAGFSFGNTTRVPGGATLTISGNGSFVDNGSFNFYSSEGSTVGNSTVNLNGGTLAAQNFVRAGGGGAGSKSTLNLNGGVLEALASDPTGSTFLPALGALTADVDTGGAIINPNGYSITIAQALVHGTGTTDGGLALSGSGTLYLVGANSYNGPTTLNNGKLNINGVNALGGANYSGIIFNGGTLQYATGFAGNGSGDVTANAGGVAQMVLINAAGATIDTNGNSVTYANAIGGNGSGGLTKVGLGNLTFNASVTYNGTTFVNQGTLTLGTAASFTNASPVITVGNGGTLALNGNTIGTSGAALTLQGGGTLSLQNNTINTVTINGNGGTALTVGDSNAPSILDFGLNSTASDQLIINNGVTTFGADGGSIYLTDLDGLAPAPSYTLISDSNGGLLTGTGTGSYFQLGTQTLILAGKGYSLSLATSTPTAVILTLSALSGVNYYWTGNSSTSWSVPGNFATDQTGSTAQAVGVSNISNVFLTANTTTSGNVAAQTLDGNYTINSLSFTGPGTAAASSIILSNGIGTHLTINATYGFTDANANNYAPGIGVVVQAGSAQQTIAANVVLGASQSWEIDNAPGSGLIVTGTIGDGGSGYGLIKTGLGTLILAGSNTYSGPTTITTGTLQLGRGVAGGSVAGNIVDNATLALNRADNYSLGNSISGAGILVQNGPDNVTLTATNTFTGSTTVNSGSLILANSLALQNSPYNTNGAGTLSFGSLTAATLGGLIGTGNLSLSNATSLPVALTLVNNAPTASYSGDLSGGGSLTKNGTSTLTLSGSNSYDGPTTINAGVIQVSAADNLGDGSANNTLVLGGGTLESTANSYNLGVNRGVSLTGSNGNIQVDSGSVLRISGTIAGAGNLVKSGSGALVINGADNATGAINVNAGTLGVGPSGSITAIASLTVANGAVLNIAGGSLTLPAVPGNPYLDYIAGGNNTQVYVSAGSFSFGNSATADPNQAMLGTFTQTGGIVTTAESNMAPLPGNTFSLYVGGTGQYISNQGLYGAMTVGTRGVASAYVSGSGSLTVGGTLIVGTQFSNVGGDTAGNRTFVQQGGTVTTNALTVGSIASTVAAVPGYYYLNGGTLTTNALAQGTLSGAGGGTFDFGGGTLISGSAFTVAAGGLTTNINSGGATINTSGGNITWAGNIGAGTVGNVTGFTGLSGGGGYTTAPTVTIAGGAGTGATAVAEINFAGQVIDVVITNPGTGYTSAPTFTFSAPTSGTTASIAAATVADTPGGLVATGTGTLTLSGTDTYAGPTAVTGGATLLVTGSLSATASMMVTGSSTLELGAPNAISSSAHVTLSNGTLQVLASETESLSDLTLGSGSSTLNLGATGTIVDFADSSADTWTGTLTITNWNGSLAGGGSDQVFIGASADLSAAQLDDITFVNGTLNGAPISYSSAIQLPDGEIVAAVPEPGEWAMALGGLAMLAIWHRRRRVS